jgi:hypothetical protein
VGALVAAEYRADPARTVRSFLDGFRGLKGTRAQKAVCERGGVPTGETLADLFRNDKVDAARVERLLAAMKSATKTVKPLRLGRLGKDHLRQTLTDLFDAAPESVRYDHATSEDGDPVPWVLEVAFGVLEQDEGRTLLTGVNSSPTLRQPFGCLDKFLADNHIEESDSVVLAVHLAHPCPVSTDRGKSRVELGGKVARRLSELVGKVAAAWRKAKGKQRRDEERLDRERHEAIKRGDRHQERTRRQQIVEAAYSVMPDAYRHAAGTQGLAAARQVMYAARALILQSGGPIWKESSYFTQRLLPDYIAANPDLTRDWDVVFDDRGHFHEPHTGKRIGIGTLSVRDYTRGWRAHLGDSPDRTPPSLSTAIRTSGPHNRYKHVLFVEKEGFMPLIRQSRLAERYDLAVMSTKGMSVTSARRLVEDLSTAGVTVFVLHDFDKSGLGILHTMRSDTRRYHFKQTPNVVDLGLRLDDVRRMELQAEEVEYSVGKDPGIRLEEYGATPEEVRFLAGTRQGWKHWVGQRVELNAMTSDQWLEFVERRLTEGGVAKVVPGADALRAAFANQARTVRINETIRSAWEGARSWVPPEPPADLARQVADLLAQHQSLSWDAALAQIVWRTVPVKTEPSADAR